MVTGDSPKLLAPKDVAALLGVDVDRVYELVAQGALAGIDVGLGATPRWRFEPEEIERFLRARLSRISSLANEPTKA